MQLRMEAVIMVMRTDKDCSLGIIIAVIFLKWVKKSKETYLIDY